MCVTLHSNTLRDHTLPPPKKRGLCHTSCEDRTLLTYKYLFFFLLGAEGAGADVREERSKSLLEQRLREAEAEAAARRAEAAKLEEQLQV